MRSLRHILGIGVLAIVLMVIGSVPVVAQLGVSTPPPPPTPGSAPTLAPYVPKGVPVVDANQAIQRTLLLDAYWASREQPLTEDVIVSDPERVMVEQYATRQEAADAYGDGVFVDPAVASEPVWVITIKGKAYVKSIGIRAVTNPTMEAMNCAPKAGHKNRVC